MTDVFNQYGLLRRLETEWRPGPARIPFYYPKWPIVQPDMTAQMGIKKALIFHDPNPNTRLPSGGTLP
jgi:hypothetical protein